MFANKLGLVKSTVFISFLVMAALVFSKTPPHDQDAGVILDKSYDPGEDDRIDTDDDRINLVLDTRMNGVGNYTILSNPGEGLNGLYQKIEVQGTMLFWYDTETHQIVKISMLRSSG